MRISGLRLVPALLLASGLFSAARAEQPMDGTFLAEKACPALASIRKGTNPDNAETEPGQGYRLLAGNQKKPTHYRIELPGAEPVERWVEADCGRIGAKPAAGAQPAKPAQSAAASQASYVLAISWQPAFCELQGRKPECRSQTNARFDANAFTLHGLWPQPSTREYCTASAADREASKSGRWRSIAEPRLSLATRQELEMLMPGSRSFLDRHEWAKHGTCYQADAEQYFRDSFRLLKAVNGSGVAGLMAGNAGRTVTAAEIRARFDRAFGAGAGNRVRVTCRDAGNRRLIAELTIGLRGDIPGGAPLQQLIMASAPVEPGCPAGEVDPVGLQ